MSNYKTNVKTKFSLKEIKILNECVPNQIFIALFSTDKKIVTKIEPGIHITKTFF